MKTTAELKAIREAFIEKVKAWQAAARSGWLSSWLKKKDK
jgi:hypothetical protein